MSTALPLTVEGWLQWLDAVNLQAEALLEHGSAQRAKAVLRDGLGLFRQCHPKAPSLLQPGIVRSLNNLARTYELLRNPQKALKCLEKARAFIGASSMLHHSAEVDTHANLAAVFTKLGRLSEAVEHCKVAIRLLQPLLFDDDVESATQSRARKFLIVAYNLAVAQSRLKLFDDAIGSSGRHLKLVHSILSADDPIRRQLINFRRNLVERMQQQMEEVASELEDPFSGTFVDARSMKQHEHGAATVSARVDQRSDGMMSSDTDADQESNFIFPAQHLGLHDLGGNNDVIGSGSFKPSSPKRAWGEQQDIRSQLQRRSSLSDNSASMKENLPLHSKNTSSESIFHRKDLFVNSSNYQAAFILQEDVPSSPGSTSSLDIGQQEGSKPFLQPLQHSEQFSLSKRQPASDAVDDLSTSVPQQEPATNLSTLHMHALDSRTAVLNLQIPPASSLQSTQLSAAIVLQRFCRYASCRYILLQTNMENALEYFSRLLLRFCLQHRYARAVARSICATFFLRLHNSRGLFSLVSRHRAVQQLGSIFRRQYFRLKLQVVNTSCTHVSRVFRGHRARTLLDSMQRKLSILVVQRRWRSHRAVRFFANFARKRNILAIGRIQLAVAQFLDIATSQTTFRRLHLRAQNSATTILHRRFQAHSAVRQLAALRFNRSMMTQNKLQRIFHLSALRIVVACRLRFTRLRAGVSVLSRAWRCSCSRRVHRTLVFQKRWMSAAFKIASMYRIWCSKRHFASATASRLALHYNKSSSKIACAWLRFLSCSLLTTLRNRLKAAHVICSLCRTYFFRGKAVELLRKLCASKISAACIAAVCRHKHNKVILPLLVERLHRAVASRIVCRAYAVARCLRRSARARVQRLAFLKSHRLIKVVRLQCALRNCIARRCMQKLLVMQQRKKREEKMIAHVNAVAIITKAWTLRILRVRAHQELKRKHAGNVIASAWQTYLSLKCKSGLTELLLRRVSASTLQRAFKCHLSRRCLYALVFQRCRSSASKTIQLAWRRVIARRVVNQRFLFRLHSIGVVDLQCLARSYIARRKLYALKQIRLQSRACSLISSFFLRKCALIRFQSIFEAQCRDFLASHLRQRFCRFRYCKQVCAVFIMHRTVSLFHRARFFSKVFLSECARTISCSRTQWCMRHVIRCMRICVSAARLSVILAASNIRRSFSRYFAATRMASLFKRRSARFELSRLMGGRHICHYISMVFHRSQLIESLSSVFIGNHLLCHHYRARFIQAWKSIRAHHIQRWWRYTRTRNRVKSLAQRIVCSYLLINRIVCKRCVKLRLKLLAASLLQRFFVFALDWKVGQERFAADYLQRRARSLIASINLYKVSCANRAFYSMLAVLKRKQFIADVIEQRHMQAATVISRCARMQHFRTQFLADVLHHHRCAAASLITSRCALFLRSHKLCAEITLMRQIEATTVIYSAFIRRFQQEIFFHQVLQARHNLIACAARCLIPFFTRVLHYTSRLQLKEHIHRQFQALARRLILHIQQPFLVDVRVNVVKNLCAYRIQIAFKAHSSRTIFAIIRQENLKLTIQRARNLAASLISRSWLLYQSRLAISMALTSSYIDIRFRSAAIICSFCLRKNEQIRNFLHAVLIVEDAAASVLQRCWLTFRSKFKFRARRGIVAWESVPKFPPKRSLASIIQRAWRCRCARALLHKQRMSVWQCTVIPTLAKYGRDMEVFAASIYSEVIVQRHSAPSLASLQAALILHAEERSMKSCTLKLSDSKSGDLKTLDPSLFAISSSSLNSDSLDLENSERVSLQLPQLTWANAIISPEDIASSAAASAAAAAAAAASDLKAAAERQAAVHARLAASAKASAEELAAREAQAASAARVIAESQRLKEEELVLHAQSLAKVRALNEAKEFARAQAAAEAKAATHAFLTARSNTAAKVRATDAAKSILDAVLMAVEFKILAISRAKARAIKTASASSKSEHLLTQLDSPFAKTAQDSDHITFELSESSYTDDPILELDRAVAALAVSEDVDADAKYFESCLQNNKIQQHEDSTAADGDNHELQAILDEISRSL